MMKKVVFIVVFAIIISAVFAVCAFASDGVEYVLSGTKDYYTLVSYKNNEAEVKISSVYNGLPVKKIAAGAFSGNISTYKIVIPDSITEIEGGAFSAMPSLHEFEASGSYTTTDGVLFTADKKTLVRYPEALEGEYTIPSGISVYPHAFSGSALNSVDGRGAANVGEYAFYMSDIKSVTFSASLKSIGGHAFEKSAIEKIELPGSTSISTYAFKDCEKLVYADIKNCALTGEGIFSGCTSLLAVSYPATQSTLPALTFAGCTSLVTAPIGENTTKIEAKAFYGCVNLIYAAVGGAEVSPDAFGLCDKVNTANKTYSKVNVNKTDVVLKVNESFNALVGSESDLFTASSSSVGVESGNIRALAEGTAEVYAVSRRGGDCKVIAVTVSDGGAVIQSDHPYGTGRYSYAYTVAGNPERIAVTFSSSDCVSPSDSISIYDKNNNCYGLFTGSALAGKTLFLDGDTLRVEIVSVTGGSYGFRVVSAVSVSSLSAVTDILIEDNVNMAPGEKHGLNAAVVPEEAFPDELVYISSDKDVVIVSADGVLFAVGEGEADVTVYSTFYGVNKTCRVKVEKRGSDFPEFEYVKKGGGAYITNYTGADKHCDIPAMIDGNVVLGIDEGAFSFKSIKSVYIPSMVGSIAQNAFDGCGSLTEFKVADSNTSFSTDGTALMSRDKTVLYKVACGVTGTYKVPDTVVQIKDGAFAYCFKIETIELGANTASLSGKAFKGASALKRITADNAALKSADGVLYTADEKTLIFFPPAMSAHTYTVIASAEKIGAYAFSGAQLNGIVLPASVSNIDATALCEAYFLSDITVNSSNAVYVWYGGALYENGALKFVPKTTAGTFTVPENVTVILPYAFYNCNQINDIIFNQNLKTVGSYAFGNCRSLSRLYLPQSVTLIGYDAFYNDDLLSVYVPENAGVSYLSSCTVLCAKGSDAADYCEQNGVRLDYTYYSDNGIWSVYSPVNGKLRIKKNTDTVYLSKVSSAAGQGITAYDVYITADGTDLPCGEYVLFKKETDDDFYFYRGKELSLIEQNAESRYRYNSDHIIELSGDALDEKIAVRTPPDKTEYKKYEDIDIKGLTIYYTDGHGMTSIVDNGFTVECDTTTSGKKKAVITYKGLRCETDITVVSTMLSGAVIITGDARYNSTLTANTTGVVPNNVSLSYRWNRNGAVIAGATSKTYTPVKDDIGKTITVTVYSTDDVDGEVTSGPVTVKKAKASSPPRPVIESSDMTFVTLKAVAGCEYRLTFDGAFTDNPTFTSLKPGTTYAFCQRYKETDTTEASDVSSISFTTKEALKIRTDVYFLNTANTAVSLVEPKTTVTAFLNNFKDKEYLSVYKDNKKITDNELVGTGCEIRLYYNGVLYDSYTVVITGDVNGDGKVTITDYLQIKERILNAKTLTPSKEYASDVNGDGKVTITDYLRLKYCIQNNQSPEQNRY